MDQSQSACRRHRPADDEHPNPNAPHSRFDSPYPACTFDMHEHIHSIEPMTPPKKTIYCWFPPMLSGVTKLRKFNRIFNNNKWRRTSKEMDVEEGKVVEILKYVVDTAPWKVGRSPSPPISTTALAHPICSQGSSQTPLNTSLATDSPAPQELIASTTPSSQPSTNVQNAASPVFQVSVPPIEQIDYEMDDQTVIESSSTPLDGSAYTATPYTQTLPEHQLVVENNLQRPMDVSTYLEMAGYTPPTIPPLPGPTFRATGSQVTQRQHSHSTSINWESQWMHMEGSLPGIPGTFATVLPSAPLAVGDNYALNTTLPTNAYAMLASGEHEYSLAAGREQDHDMIDESIASVHRPVVEVVRPVVPQEFYAMQLDEDTEMNIVEPQLGSLERHTEGISDRAAASSSESSIRPPQIPELRPTASSRDVGDAHVPPTTINMPSSNTGEGYSGGNPEYLAAPNSWVFEIIPPPTSDAQLASSSRAMSVDSSLIAQPGSLGESLRGPPASQDPVLLVSPPAPAPVRPVGPPLRIIDEDYDTPEVVETLARRRQKPYDRYKLQSKPPKGQHKEKLKRREMMSSIYSPPPLAVGVAVPSRDADNGFDGRDRGITEVSNAPAPGRPNCEEAGPSNPLTGPSSAVGAWKDPKIPKNIPARGELERTPLPTSVEAFNMKKVVLEPTNTPRDPRPNRPDPLDGLASLLGQSSMTENSREHRNVNALRPSLFAQYPSPTPGYDGIESINSQRLLRQQNDAQRIRSWYETYTCSEPAVNVDVAGQEEETEDPPNLTPTSSGEVLTMEDLPDYEAVNEQNESPTTPGLTHGLSLSEDWSEDNEEVLENHGHPSVIVELDERHHEDEPCPVSEGQVQAWLDGVGIELKEADDRALAQKEAEMIGMLERQSIRS